MCIYRVTGVKRTTVIWLIGSLVSLTLPGCGNTIKITGKWEGLLDVGAAVGVRGKPKDTGLHTVFHVWEEGDRLHASLETLEDRSGVCPSDSVEFKDHSLTAKFRNQTEIYAATLNLDGNVFHGRLKWGSYDIPLDLKRASGN